jgi:hypothetical protein
MMLSVRRYSAFVSPLPEFSVWIREERLNCR